MKVSRQCCVPFCTTSSILQRSAMRPESDAGAVSRPTTRAARAGGGSSSSPTPTPATPQMPAVDPHRPEPTFKELYGLASSPNSSTSNMVKAVFDVSTPDWAKLRDTMSVSELYTKQKEASIPPKGLMRRKRRLSADMEFVRLLQSNTTFNANRLGQDRYIDNQSKGTSPGSRSLWEDEENFVHWQPTAAAKQRKTSTPAWAPHTSAAFKSRREADAYPPGPKSPMLLDEAVPPPTTASAEVPQSAPAEPSPPVPLPIWKSTDPTRTDFDSNTKMDTVEELGKHLFIDAKAGWCYLCEEPVGILAAVHSGDRDHMCIHFFLLLHAHMPMRSWGSAHAVLEAAQELGNDGNGRLMDKGRLFRHVSATHTMEHLHTQPDAVRRAELHSLLLHLTRPPHKVITHALQGRAEVGVWYSGERMFRAELARKSTQLFPPMSAGVITQFNHKCWGRTNLERTFDALNIAGILNAYGAPAPTEKDDKAYFMRSLFAVLMHAPITEGVNEVGIELARVARQRLVFEMIFLQSMQFMVKAQAAMKRLGYPTYDDLVALGLS